jgi:hypothetical protein
MLTSYGLPYVRMALYCPYVTFQEDPRRPAKIWTEKGVIFLGFLFKPLSTDCPPPPPPDGVPFFHMYSPHTWDGGGWGGGSLVGCVGSVCKTWGTEGDSFWVTSADQGVANRPCVPTLYPPPKHILQGFILGGGKGDQL